MNLIYCPVCNHLLQIDRGKWVGGGRQTCDCGESWGEQIVKDCNGEDRAVHGGRAIPIVIRSEDLQAKREQSPDLAHGMFYLPRSDDPYFTRVDDKGE